MGLQTNIRWIPCKETVYRARWIIHADSIGNAMANSVHTHALDVRVISLR